MKLHMKELLINNIHELPLEEQEDILKVLYKIHRSKEVKNA